MDGKDKKLKGQKMGAGFSRAQSENLGLEAAADDLPRQIHRRL